jgi:hypothetical protein
MIWPEVWPFVLVVVLGKDRARKWVNKTYSRSRKHCDMFAVRCECSDCRTALDFVFEWVRIG